MEYELERDRDTICTGDDDDIELCPTKYPSARSFRNKLALQSVAAANKELRSSHTFLTDHKLRFEQMTKKQPLDFKIARALDKEEEGE